MTSSQVHPWRVVIDAPLATAAQAVARELATRLRDQGLLEVAFQRVTQQTLAPNLTQWRPETLSTGDAGLALLCAYLDACFPAEGWDQIGHTHLLKATQEAANLPHLHVGLFAGLSGLTYAAWSLSHEGKRYQRLLTTLTHRLVPMVHNLVQLTLEQSHGFPVVYYDVVTGLAGVGACLLSISNYQGLLPLETVLESLVYLAREEVKGLPAWYVPPFLSRLESWGDLCPDGFYNCGFAHGIPGPLALLALAKSARITVPGLEAAISRTADWLLEQQISNEWGIGWPLAVPVNHKGPPPGDLKRCRTAWCYGTPGVARALWLAGEALTCQHYQEVALAAMQSVYRTPIPERRIDSPSFCHGVAGLLQMTLRFAHDSQAPFFVEAANILTEQLLSLYDPDTLLGYCNQEGPETLVDQPGLLDGVAGILLVLLAASTTQEPYWDRVFLLS